MCFYRCAVLTSLSLCLFARTAVHSRCVQGFCRTTNQPRRNDTMTYYNIAMVTRKLSGILIMLLLFAAGYFVQRMMCTRSRQRAAPLNAQPDVVTASQEMLMDRCTPDSLLDPLHVAQLPAYDACKRLPTYEETMREGNGGRPEDAARAT